MSFDSEKQNRPLQLESLTMVHDGVQFQDWNVEHSPETVETV